MCSHLEGTSCTLRIEDTGGQRSYGPCEVSVLRITMYLGTVPVYFVKRPVDFGSRLRANENDSDKTLYGSLDQREERSVMA